METALMSAGSHTAPDVWKPPEVLCILLRERTGAQCSNTKSCFYHPERMRQRH